MGCGVGDKPPPPVDGRDGAQSCATRQRKGYVMNKATMWMLAGVAATAACQVWGADAAAQLDEKYRPAF